MGQYQNALQVPESHVMRLVAERQNLIRKEVEDFMVGELEAYPTRAESRWVYDTSSEKAFLASVAENRERWKSALGVYDFSSSETPVAEEEPFLEDDHIVAKYVHVQISGNLRAHGIFATPKKASGPLPLVLCQHGVGSSPEKVFGFGDPDGMYKSYARRVVEAGYAVLAPAHITYEGRRRAHRQCLLLGGTLYGLEVGKLSRMLDWAAARPDVDGDRMAMWGLSLGGVYTQITLPVEQRLKVGISSAWFNDRVRKMAMDDTRWSGFISSESEHIFIPGWLERFGEAELVSLVCPRPLLIQAGKGDSISWHPHVEAEFMRSKKIYEALGIGERLQMDLHEGGHEIRLESGLNFLEEQL